MIKTKEIDKYIHNVLLKRKDTLLTEDDLKIIKRIVLSAVDFDGEKITYDFDDIKQLTNLGSCTLEFFEIDNEIVSSLSSLKRLEELNISHCKFLNSNKISCNLKTLIISYTDLNEFDILEFPEGIDTLKLIEVGKIDFNILTKLKNIKNLYIYNSEINNIKEISKLTVLSRLKLDGTKIDDEDILIKLDKNIQIQRKDVYLLES